MRPLHHGEAKTMRLLPADFGKGTGCDLGCGRRRGLLLSMGSLETQVLPWGSPDCPAGGKAVSRASPNIISAHSSKGLVAALSSPQTESGTLVPSLQGCCLSNIKSSSSTSKLITTKFRLRTLLDALLFALSLTSAHLNSLQNLKRETCSLSRKETLTNMTVLWVNKPETGGGHPQL